MNCERCDGELVDQSVDICVCESEPARVIRGVPALVCPRCDERVFSGEVALLIDGIRDRSANPSDYDDIRPLLVYQYETAQRQTTRHVVIDTTGSAMVTFSQAGVPLSPLPSGTYDVGCRTCTTPPA